MSEIKIGFVLATNNVDVHWFKPLAFGYLKAFIDKNKRNKDIASIL